MKNMKRNDLLKCGLTALSASALLTLTSCSSTPPQTVQPLAPSTFNSGTGFGGEIVTDGSSRTATIVSVDRNKRLVVVKRANGHEVTYKVAPNAPGFDVIKAGDVVKVSVADELAIFLGRNSVPPDAGMDAARLRVRLPGSTQAVAAEVATQVFTAKIIAIDDWQGIVTLQFPDGLTKTIRVSEYINLADFNVGDNVSAESTEAAVLLLEKP
jgi:hypothetical protein